MNKEQMRIAIAKKMGFTGCDDAKCEYRKCQHLHKLGRVYFPESFSIPMYPNYPDDLNACHEAVESLGIDGEEWAVALWKVTVGGKPITDRKAMLLFSNATAPQRCEAMLRVWGLWKEGGE